MVDSISSAKGIRPAGSSRYGASPAKSQPSASSRAVTPVQAAPDAGREDDQGRRGTGEPEVRADLRLEISEDESGNEVVYRFVDARTGNLVREWDAGEFGKLRDYVRNRNLHLLDTKA